MDQISEAIIYQKLSELNPWGNYQAPKLFERQLVPQLQASLTMPEATIIKGIRRCGKSTMLRLLANTIPNPQQVLHVNFEDPVFAKQNHELLSQILRIYRERHNPDQKAYLFFDEIQNIAGWEKWVRMKVDHERNHKLFLSGSSAKLLSAEIGTALTGRNLTFEAWPLSFSEFLSFQGLALGAHPTNLALLKHKTKIRRYLREFLRFGGFPEVVLRPEPQFKTMLLGQYFDDILYRDIVERHSIRDIGTLKQLAVYGLSQSAQLTAMNRVKNLFAVPLDIARHYFAYCCDSYLLLDLPKFSYKVSERLRAPRKFFACDLGMQQFVAGVPEARNLGWQAETIVHLHLRHSAKELYFLENGCSIDFLVLKGGKPSQLIQVCYSNLSDPRTREREITALQTAMSEFKLNKGLIITDDYSDVVSVGKKTINCVPLWRWLLGEPIK